jgi:enterochelin esterase-like enzyme
MCKFYVVLFILVPMLWAAGQQASISADLKNPKSHIEKIDFISPSLNQMMKMNVYFPPDYDKTKTYPVLYLLHGSTANEDFIMPLLGVNRKSDKLIQDGKIRPMIIVAPYIRNSWCLNSSWFNGVHIIDKVTKEGCTEGKYEDYMMKDVIGYVEAHYPVIKNRDNRYIGGISMGGFGALYLAFRHPDMFSKVGGHSAALFSSYPDIEIVKWLYSNGWSKGRNPIELAKNKDLKGLKIYLDCGDKDKLLPDSNELEKVLLSRNFSVEKHIGPGDHALIYWMKNMEDYLLFYGAK